MFLVFAFSLLAVALGAPLAREQPRGFGSAKHVLVIGCDGLGGMYVENATQFLPNIARFYKEGSTTTRARDQMPSVSAPNWATIIAGQGPEESGVQGNDWVPAQDDPPNSVVEELPPISGRGKIPETMWRAAKAQSPDLVVAVVESWGWIHLLVEAEVVQYEYDGFENDSACAAALEGFIMQHKPNLMFIHFDSIDDAGHAHQWGSPQYYDAVKKVDGYIGGIFAALDKAGLLADTLLILTADHGGYRFSHGSFNQACMYIPALFMGPGVKQGHTIQAYTTNKDFAPTALNALGLQPGPYMVGNIVEEMYSA